MRKSIISNLGFVLQTAGILIILPIIVAFYYEEKESLISLFLTSFTFFSIGFLMNSLAERKELDFKSSCLLVTVTFFIVALIGSIPYLYLRIFNSNSVFKNIIDSYFESISGFTTTGFSLIENLEILPKSIILYRSLTQWIGGIGIVYLILAFFYPEEILNNILEAIGFKKTLSKIKNSMIEVIAIYSFYTILYFSLFYY
ncbi:MAG: potassium transporter TrkG, partial [Candidatus Aenigmatarchaeota archaeon]